MCDCSLSPVARGVERGFMPGSESIVDEAENFCSRNSLDHCPFV